MRRHHTRWLLPAMLAWATATATAQGAPTSPSARPAADPLDASAQVPTLVYESSLSTYKRLGEIEALSWREANDRVARIGGWRAYAREANAPDAPDAPDAADAPGAPARAASAPVPAPAANAASMPKPAPLPSPHSGHKMH